MSPAGRCSIFSSTALRQPTCWIACWMPQRNSAGGWWGSRLFAGWESREIDVRVPSPSGRRNAPSATDEGLRCWQANDICPASAHVRYRGGISRSDIVTPHPPLQGTFSQREKEAPVCRSGDGADELAELV